MRPRKGFLCAHAWVSALRAPTVMRHSTAEPEQALALRAQSPHPVTVADVMVRDPKTLSAAATVQDAVMALQDDHVHLVLVIDADRLVGTMGRTDVPDRPVAVGARAIDFATLVGRTVRPDAAARDAMAHMRITSIRRLAVVDGDDRLLGLLCLKRTGRGFCSNDDVASRRRPHTHRHD